jgi:hypothetical protein
MGRIVSLLFGGLSRTFNFRLFFFPFFLPFVSILWMHRSKSNSLLSHFLPTFVSLPRHKSFIFVSLSFHFRCGDWFG